MNALKLQLAVCLVVFGLAASSTFAAQGTFQQRHPRRAEVLKREKQELNKNEAAESSGKITEKQEARLNRQDQLIKKEEQADAAANGGHITKGEQRDLNRQENKVNRERRRMEKRDAAMKGKVESKEAPVAPSAGVPVSTVPAGTSN